MTITITEPPTLDLVLTLATRLPPTDKLRLIERLAPQISAALPGAVEPGADPLVELDALIAESAALGPAAMDSAELISELRR